MSSGAGANRAADGEPAQQRYAERHDLEVAVDLKSDTNFYTGLTRNISTGGLFIATHNIKRVGDRLRIRFTLPGADRAIFVDTEVRWIRENSPLVRTESAPGMGLRFVDLSPDDVRMIQSFIQHRESLFYDDD